jgi:hypothetical protein
VTVMKYSFLSIAILFSLGTTNAFAQEIIIGWEGSPSNGYGFVMPVVSVPKTDTSSAFVIRPAVGYLYYNFREAGGLTDVTSPVVSIGIAYRLRLPRVSMTLGPGLEVRWEHRKQANGTRIDKTQTGATASADLFIQANSHTNLSVIATYSQTNRYLWSRAGIKRQITNSDFRGSSPISIGAEVTGQGNHDVRQVQLGGLMEVGFLSAHSSLQFRSGYARLLFIDGSIETRPYFGIGLYRAF